MRSTTGHPASFTSTIAVALLVLAGEAAAPASAGDWLFRIQPTIMDAYGHDQHVLNIHDIDTGTSPTTDTTTAFKLDTESSLAFHGEFQYVTSGAWTWGVDVAVFYTDQVAPNQTAAGVGPNERMEFEVADRSFASGDPSDELFYGVLEDTSMQTWTVDLYGLRTLSEGEHSKIQLRLGVRTADFDNDYRAVVGIQDQGGRRLDASSNYDRMTGPLIGFTGRFDKGRSVFLCSISQSVLLGSVELTSTAREFTGQLSAAFPVEGDIATTTATESFKTVDDVAIPVTDLELSWTYGVTRWLALGAGVTSSAWWDVPVPPGVIPGEGGLETLHENTIVFFGVSGIVELRF